MPYVGFSYVKLIRSEVRFNQDVVKKRIRALKDSLEESKEKESVMNKMENNIITEISFYERELEILEKVEKLLEGEIQYV